MEQNSDIIDSSSAEIDSSSSSQTTTTTTSQPAAATLSACQLDVEDRVARLNALLRLEEHKMKPIQKKYRLAFAKSRSNKAKKMKEFRAKYKLKKDEEPRTDVERAEMDEIDVEHAKEDFEILRRQLEELRPFMETRASIIQGRMGEPEVLDTKCFKCKKEKCGHKVRLTKVVTLQSAVDEQCILEEEANFNCSAYLRRVSCPGSGSPLCYPCRVSLSILSIWYKIHTCWPI